MNNYIRHKIVLGLALGIGMLGVHSVAAPPESVKPMRIGVIGAVR